MMVEVQCSSCHTRYRVDEQVLPEGTPTFKCSRCGHVFTVEPRKAGETAATESAAPKPAASEKPARPPATRLKAEPPASEPPQPRSQAQPQVPSTSPETIASTVTSASRASAEPQAAPAVGSAPASGTEPTAKPASGQKRGTEELLDRPFTVEPEQTDFGENLAFDFHDEAPTEDELAAPKPKVVDSPRVLGGRPSFNRREPSRWLVGDDPEEEAADTSREGFAIGTPPSGRRRATGRAKTPGSEPEMVDEAAAPVYNRSVTRSARFFLALFFLVACGFIATTFAIHAAPSAALSVLNRLPVIGARFTSPVVPAELVALRDVHAEYGHGRDGRLALVVEGNAENVSSAALHTVRIMARIWTTSGTAVARRQVYCGNSVGTRTIAQMTTHEIEFFEGLPPPKTFSLDSSSACPFVIVFVDPPPQVGHFDIAVTQADAADSAPATPPS